MTKPRSHHLGIYNYTLHLATTVTEWEALDKRFEGNLIAPDAIGIAQFLVDSESNNAPHCAVYLDPRAAGDQRTLVATIAHESFHAAAQLLDHIGQATTSHDSETTAYLVDFIAGWLWDQVS